jgi:hypothetical protein
LFTAGISAGAGHLFDHDDGGQRVRTGTAVLLGDVRGVEVRRLERVVRRFGELGELVHVTRVRGYLGVTDVADGLPDRLVLLGQRVQVE